MLLRRMRISADRSTAVTSNLLLRGGISKRITQGANFSPTKPLVVTICLETAARFFASPV
jgi:hypothetical protein